MYQLIIKHRAVEMAKDAYSWYEEQQPGLGNLFLTEVEGCYNKIEAWPAAYATIKNNFRQIILKTFPYVIVFEIHNNDVVVYAIFHTSRNPKQKFKKK